MKPCVQHAQCEECCRQLEEREHQLVQQVNGLERQLSRVPPPTQSTQIPPEVLTLQEQLKNVEESNSNLRAQLQEKVSIQYSFLYLKNS